MVKIFGNNDVDNLIYMHSPSDEDLNNVSLMTGVKCAEFKKVLDKHESARVETKDGTLIIVLSVPIKREKGFRTLPIGIMATDSHIIVLSNNELSKKICNRLNFDDMVFDDKIGSVLQIILEIKEKNLLKASNNEDMKELLEIQKGLVYFIKALNENEAVLEKLLQRDLSSDNKILLDDIIIENKQSINMATLYQDLLKSVMESYATIISNNLNKVMKFLTGITIVFTIPTMVASFMGMNVKLGFFNDNDLAFLILLLISILLSLLAYVVFKRKNWL